MPGAYSLVVVVLVIAATSFSALYFFPYSHNIPPCFANGPPDDVGAFYDALLKRNATQGPCVVRSVDFVKKWIIWEKSLSWLSKIRSLNRKENHELGTLRLQTNGMTLYSSSGSKENTLILKTPQTTEKKHIAYSSVVKYVLSSSVAANNFTYHSINVEDMPRVLSLIDPLPKPSAPFKLKQVVLWTGSNGVVATPHYDANFNLFVQLHGSKQWSFWEPGYFKHLDLFPYLSNHARQARPSAWKTPAQWNTRVDKGDVLFVPQCWFHRVECVGIPYCLSANFWVAGPVSTLQDSNWMLGLQFQQQVEQLFPESEKHTTLLRAKKILLYQVIKRIEQRIQGLSIRTIITQRYQPVLGDIEKDLALCPAASTNDNGDATIHEAIVSQFVNRAIAVNQQPDKGVFLLLMTNLIETLALSSERDPNEVYKYLHSCF